jgi:hypothetical protein
MSHTLRSTAKDYLKATTTMTKEEIDRIEDGQYPKDYKEKPDLWGAKQYEAKRHAVHDAARTLQHGAYNVLNLVLRFHDDLSDLAKGPGFTDFYDAREKSTLNRQFENRSYGIGGHVWQGDLEWRKYVDKLEFNNVISGTEGEAWKAETNPQARRDKVFQTLYDKMKGDRGKPVPISLLWGLGLSGWFQVELDFMKTYVKLFNARGKSGAKLISQQAPLDLNTAAGLKEHYSPSLESHHAEELEKDYRQYAEELGGNDSLSSLRTKFDSETGRTGGLVHAMDRRFETPPNF